MSAGRPLRFLATAVGGWVVLRALALWPHAAALERPAAMPAPMTMRAVRTLRAAGSGDAGAVGPGGVPAAPRPSQIMVFSAARRAMTLSVVTAAASGTPVAASDTDRAEQVTAIPPALMFPLCNLALGINAARETGVALAGRVSGGWYARGAIARGGVC